jgi:hypothetical protein
MIAARIGTTVIRSKTRHDARGARRRPPVEALIALVVTIAALAIFDVAALLFGADSRDGFTDDCLRTTLS